MFHCLENVLWATAINNFIIHQIFSDFLLLTFYDVGKFFILSAANISFFLLIWASNYTSVFKKWKSAAWNLLNYSQFKKGNFYVAEKNCYRNDLSVPIMTKVVC